MGQERLSDFDSRLHDASEILSRRVVPVPIKEGACHFSLWATTSSSSFLLYCTREPQQMLQTSKPQCSFYTSAPESDRCVNHPVNMSNLFELFFLTSQVNVSARTSIRISLAPRILDIVSTATASLLARTTITSKFEESYCPSIDGSP